MSDNFVFHACALLRVFSLTERQTAREVATGRMTKEEVRLNLHQSNFLRDMLLVQFGISFASVRKEFRF